MEPTEFHLFPKFPQEIQDMVWKHASHLVKARVVGLVQRRNSQGYLSPPYSTDSPCPPLLHVCKASRAIMLKDWPLCFSIGEDQAHIPFNFAIDTLCFNNFTSFTIDSSLKLEERKKILRLAFAFEEEYLDEFGDDFDIEWAERVGELLHDGFPVLHTVVWTYGGEPSDWGYWETFDGSRMKLHKNPGINYFMTDPLPKPREKMTSYWDYWNLDMDLKVYGMLPHYLYLGDPPDRSAYELDQDHVSWGPPDEALAEYYKEYTDWTLPKFEFAKPVIKIIGVDQDSWGSDIGEVARTDRESRKIHEEKETEVKRLHGVRKQKYLERVQLEESQQTHKFNTA